MLIVAFFPKSSPDRLKLFRNAWLERQTVISVPAFVALWAVVLPVIALVAWSVTREALSGYPAVLAGVALVGVGLAGWSLAEYVLHRFVFHLKPRSRLLARLVFLLHGNHHAVPDDPLRNLMPPIVSLPLGGLIWTLCVALAGPAGSWVFLGFMLGYVGYDLVHYACHQWPMTGRLARRIKRNHMLHHHARKDGNFAITGMVWDRLFGTRLMTRTV